MTTALSSLLLLFVIALNVLGGTETNILPGLTYFRGDEHLKGKLTFLHRHRYIDPTNSSRAASICAFDLALEKLTALTDCPTGTFLSSMLGDTCCVIYSHGIWALGNGTNVIIYSEAQDLSRNLSLTAEPKLTVIAGNHIFFELEGHGGYKSVGQYLSTDSRELSTTTIVSYDVRRNEQRVLGLDNADKWEYQHYDRSHLPRDQTNQLHFKYRRGGKRLTEGKTYREGFYSLDLETGSIEWMGTQDNDDSRYALVGADNRHVFFEGSEAPISGFRLVSSPWVPGQLIEPQPKNKKVLHSFSKVSALTGGAYWLQQLSPDRRYALVRFAESTSRKTGMMPGWSRTYYLVRLNDGKTRVLLKDRVGSKTESAISEVRWVGPPE